MYLYGILEPVSEWELKIKVTKTHKRVVYLYCAGSQSVIFHSLVRVDLIVQVKGRQGKSLPWILAMVVNGVEKRNIWQSMISKLLILVVPTLITIKYLRSRSKKSPKSIFINVNEALSGRSLNRWLMLQFNLNISTFKLYNIIYN